MLDSDQGKVAVVTPIFINLAKSQEFIMDKVLVPVTEI